MNKPWGRMREHGPSLIFEWYETREQAERGIDDAEKMYGGAVRKVQVVAYFPHRDENDKGSTFITSESPMLDETEI